jgi:hypothetical protein
MPAYASDASWCKRAFACGRARTATTIQASEAGSACGTAVGGPAGTGTLSEDVSVVVVLARVPTVAVDMRLTPIPLFVPASANERER